MTVSIVSEKPKEMKMEIVPPESLRSDIWIDEVLIIKAWHFRNIFHNMEHINNLLHCTSISNGCPRVFMIYVISYSSTMSSFIFLVPISI